MIVIPRKSNPMLEEKKRKETEKELLKKSKQDEKERKKLEKELKKQGKQNTKTIDAANEVIMAHAKHNELRWQCQACMNMNINVYVCSCNKVWLCKQDKMAHNENEVYCNICNEQSPLNQEVQDSNNDIEVDSNGSDTEVEEKDPNSLEKPVLKREPIKRKGKRQKLTLEEKIQRKELQKQKARNRYYILDLDNNITKTRSKLEQLLNLQKELKK